MHSGDWVVLVSHRSLGLVISSPRIGFSGVGAGLEMFAESWSYGSLTIRHFTDINPGVIPNDFSFVMASWLRDDCWVFGCIRVDVFAHDP